MSKSFAEMWDTEVKPLAQQVVEECTTDGLAAHYVSQMIFYVEHDLADGRLASAKVRLFPCVGTLNDDSYYEDVFGEETEETKLLRKLGGKLQEVLDC